MNCNSGSFSSTPQETEGAFAHELPLLTSKKNGCVVHNQLRICLEFLKILVFAVCDVLQERQNPAPHLTFHMGIQSSCISMFGDGTEALNKFTSNTVHPVLCLGNVSNSIVSVLGAPQSSFSVL